MHGNIGKHNEGTTEDGETDCVAPESQHVEPERRQDGRAGDLDVDPVLVIYEAEVFDFVHNQAFEAVVEDGKLRNVPSQHQCEWSRVSDEKKNRASHSGTREQLTVCSHTATVGILS